MTRDRLLRHLRIELSRRGALHSLRAVTHLRLLIDRIEDMLLQERLRIEVSDIEILETGSEILLQLITSTGREISDLLDESRSICRCLRKTIRTDEDHAKDGKSDDLTAADIEHMAILVRARLVLARGQSQ